MRNVPLSTHKPEYNRVAVVYVLVSACRNNGKNNIYSD